jgi:hypothetical protein
MNALSQLEITHFADLPDGGKCGLSKEFLVRNAYTLLASDYQLLYEKV